MKRKLSLALAVLILATALAVPALASSETETAATYLVERGILAGNENGDLMLDKSLTRAELAVILTRLDFTRDYGGVDEWYEWGNEQYGAADNQSNPFTDVPFWARAYVEYCYRRSLMNGVAETKFDAEGKVNPKMACTVILRYCGIAETDWNYSTSVEKAKSLGLTPSDGIDGDIILRGAMAAILYRGMNYDPTGAPTVTPSQQPVPTPTPSAEIDLYEYAVEVIRYTNIEREKEGLPPLIYSAALTEAAMRKSQDMVDNDYVGHDSPVFGRTENIVALDGWKYQGENVTDSGELPLEAVRTFIFSKGHKDNILRVAATHIGVGVAIADDGSFRWTQLFGSNIKE